MGPSTSVSLASGAEIDPAVPAVATATVGGFGQR